MRAASSDRPGQILLRLYSGLRIALTMAVMTGCALAMMAAAIATLFRARRLYSEWIAAPCARLVLRIWGIHLVVLGAESIPRTQSIYISNHTSTIDMFVLLALELPNTRFFLSGFLRKLLPLGLIGYLIGVFWTPTQKFPKRRKRTFERAEAVLRHTGESVYLSPEGERVTTGEIGHFNKGAFHLATNLKVPIVPLYIAISQSMNRGRSWHVRPGKVHVYFKSAIATAHWTQQRLINQKDEVRNLFLQWHQTHRS
jgi:1-acyl-sn-glycerol-3-phosphate acyltransferase